MQILLNLGSIVISLVTYVLMAVGLYSVAKRRGIRNPWLAWIPLVNVWVLGCISDQYRYVAKGQNKSKRKVLLTLSIIVEVVSIVLLVVTVLWCISLMGQFGLGDLSLGDWMYVTTLDQAGMEAFFEEHILIQDVIMDEQQMLQSLLGGILGVLGLALLLVPLGIWYTIVYYMALYDLYASAEPKNATIYLVLSILIGGILTGILILVCKDRDDGMPPRQVVEPVMQELPQTGWQGTVE
ncbi:MAG: hypothetical protein II320_01525 [Oscillospiraceae bacterium]|nr:hypothetical protein [Oscillospiraceae bacterium]